MENILLDIGGKEFYFDIEVLSQIIRIDIDDQNLDIKNNKDIKTESIVQVDVAKYELYRDFITTILSCNEVIDDKMGIMGLNSLSIPFKISFNSLIMKGIIKEL